MTFFTQVKDMYGMVKARMLFQLAANHGHMNAQFELAYRVKVAPPPTDPIEARKLYRLAADRDPGRRNAQYNFAKMCYDGRGGPVDLDQALKFASLANNHPNANHLLHLVQTKMEKVSPIFD